MKATAFKDITPKSHKPHWCFYYVSKHAYLRLKERWPSIFKLGDPAKVLSSIMNSTKPYREDNDAKFYRYQDYIIVVKLGTNIIKTVKYANHK